jgi:hypothetical protein
MSKGRTTNSKQHVETTNHGYDVDDFLVERNELSDCLVYFVVEKGCLGTHAPKRLSIVYLEAVLLLSVIMCFAPKTQIFFRNFQKKFGWIKLKMPSFALTMIP